MARYPEYRYVDRRVCDRSIRNAQSESIYRRDRRSLRIKRTRSEASKTVCRSQANA